MNYIGSKAKLCKKFIPDAIHSVCGNDLSQFILCDIFAGTGAVGKTFKKECKKIISNDTELYSYILNRNYIQNRHIGRRAAELIEELNHATAINDGFIFENYSDGGKAGRLYFSAENGKIIDSARILIDRWKRERKISPDEYYFLMASLIESADKVANTASVYASHLKELKASAKRTMVIKGAEFTPDNRRHIVYMEDANLLIKRISGDILYLDPPYNHRQYGCYYHLLNTIAEYKPFLPKGVTGIRSYSRSLYCISSEASHALENLISDANFRYVFLSYNNEGIIPCEEIKRIFEKHGTYSVFHTKYQRFKQDSARTSRASETTEFLHVLEKKHNK